ncbi:MAG: hypothetical protein GY925_19395 [Actinomycetia bacterium]|nr:hypothetical protein [Actinomycetes bacterium]
MAIDPGAPVPHLVTDGLRAVLVFHAGLQPDPDWDGTSVTVVDPADATIRNLGWIVFEGIREVSMGGSNDEGLHEHPLNGSGLVHYRAHEVQPIEPSSRQVIITFHDETFTCLCSEWSSGSLAADFRTAMALAANALRHGAAAFDGRDTRSAGTELHPDRLPFVQLFWNRQILDEAVEDARNAGWEIVHLNAEGWTTPERIDEHIVRWAMQKYKRLRGQPTKAWRWLNAARERQPRLFAHWHLLAPTQRRTAGAV